MTKISLNSVWGNELKDLGFKKIKVNHFEKKIKNHWLIIDYEIQGKNLLMFRFLRIDAFNRTKCIKQIDTDNWFSLTQFGFIDMIKNIESYFKFLIEE
jgi:hypothetical protein